jgi:hypothetical protein
VCGFGVLEGRALEYVRENGYHRNALGNDSPNAGIAYCPYCDDETLRNPGSARGDRMSERLFTHVEIMALVHRVFDEIRNGATTPTLGAVAWRLDEELKGFRVVTQRETGNQVSEGTSGSVPSAAQKEN